MRCYAALRRRSGGASDKQDQNGPDDLARGMHTHQPFTIFNTARRLVIERDRSVAMREEVRTWLGFGKCADRAFSGLSESLAESGARMEVLSFGDGTTPNSR